MAADSGRFAETAPSLLASDSLSQAEALLANDPLSETELERAYSTEMDSIVFADRIVHLYESSEYDELFCEVEDRAFLSRQASYFNGFQNGSRDLETYVLPAAIEEAQAGDPRDGWARFLHMALVAANFRGLANALAEDEILAALVAHGQRRLALDVADQLADPAVRVRARAVILAGSPQSPDEPELLRQIEGDLDAFLETPSSSNTPEGAGRVAVLRCVALEIGPLLRHRWDSWLKPLGLQADEVWEAIIESWIRREEWTAPGLIEAVTALSDRERLRDFLPARFAIASEAAAAFLDVLADSGFQENRLDADLRLARIARRAVDDPQAARAAWAELVAQLSLWDVKSVELGHGLWSFLTREQIGDLLPLLDGAEARAALLITVLEKNFRLVGPEEALETVFNLADEAAKLHWCLRYLAAQPAVLQTQKQSLLSSVAQYLYHNRYDAPAKDLALFLDLVAQYLPKELSARTDDVVRSPASRPETLLILASSATSREVLNQLLSRVESFAAAVSHKDEDGFELRRKLIVRLAVRLARDMGDPQSIDRAAALLLPQEENELRSTVIRELLEKDESFRPLAKKFYEGLKNTPRLKLLMRLRIEDDSAKLAELVRPAALYRGVASTSALEDELQALTALHRIPERPRELARTHLARVRDPERRVLGLCELARRCLAYQRKRYPPRLRDHTAALQPLYETLNAAAMSQERHVALIPELVSISAELGTSPAVAELQEASLRLLGPDAELAWRVRRRTFESILTRLSSLVLNPVEPIGYYAPRCRATAGFLDWLTELPQRTEFVELRRQWHDIFPMIVATAELLGPKVELYLRHPFGTRLSWEILGHLPSLDLSRRLESFLPRSVCSRPTPWSASQAELLSCWGWLTQKQRSVVALCCQPLQERLRRAEDLLRWQPKEVDEPEVLALVSLLAHKTPEIVPELVRLLPKEGRRESCWRLLRLSWGDPGQMRRLLRLVEDRREAVVLRLWRQRNRPSSSWVKALGELAAGGEVDPLDPPTLSLQQALMNTKSAAGCKAMAYATISALRRQGKAAAERVLRLWLRTFLSNDADGAGEYEVVISATLKKAQSIDCGKLSGDLSL